MARSADLAAGQFEVTRAGRLEPDPGNGATRHGRLIKTELGYVERMDDVARVQIDVHRPVHRNDQLRAGKIVVPGRIVRDQTEFVVHRVTVHIDLAEASVRPRITHVPAELVTDHIDPHRVFRGRTVQLGPEAVAVNDEAEENGRGNGRPDDLQRVVAVAVVGFRTRTPAVFDQIVNVDALGENKDRGSEVKDEIEQGVDFLRADRRCLRRPIQIALAHLRQHIKARGEKDHHAPENQIS